MYDGSYFRLCITTAWVKQPYPILWNRNHIQCRDMNIAIRVEPLDADNAMR